MSAEENKSFGKKNEERIQEFVDNIDEKGAEKKEQKKEEIRETELEETRETE